MLSLRLITPEKVVTEIEATSVTLHTESGEITVLPGHIPVFTKLKPGQLTIRTGDKIEYLAVNGGFADISGTSIKILADAAVRAEEIDELKAQKAKEDAEKALATAESDVDFASTQSALGRALLELETLSKWRKIKHH